MSDLKQEILEAVSAAGDLDALEDVRVKSLGKKGSITAAMKSLGQMDPEERREKGQAFNALKTEVAVAIEARKKDLAGAALLEKLSKEKIDVTLSHLPEETGTIHPISYVMEEIISIFGEMGFGVSEGPDIEDDFHNFVALNFPQNHPAREMQDTFFMEKKDAEGTPLLMRTHTSPVQIRTMLKEKPPIRIIAPGRTYRCDHDATHSPMFHQVEGLVIEEKIHMGHLKGVLAEFCRVFFEVSEVPLRFRPSFFPFTEPSAEIDIGCARTKDGLEIGAGKGWMEVLGAGMVHPNVIKNCGLDPERHQGFAFGMGVERLAMLKYGIPDLRTFFESDIRWLKHYGFSPIDIPSLVRRAGA
ncbi:MAG: phenylalanine--tRNA ligase subunit alpha [Alphaproteobacteria bacterium]